MADMIHHQEPYKRYLQKLEKEVPFITHAKLINEPLAAEARGDALLEVKTAKDTHLLVVEVKRNFLDKAMANAMIIHQRENLKTHGRPLVLFAPYIPQPTGELLADAGLNFVDEVGNVHLNLDDRYHVLKLGRRRATKIVGEQRAGAAMQQVIYVLLVEPQAVTWPVRTLAQKAGVGKTAAADVRQRLEAEGMLRRGAKPRIEKKKLIDQFLGGYTQVLRPHLLTGRFRAQEREPEKFVDQVEAIFKQDRIQWALTGGAAANEMDRFYRGQTTTFYAEEFTTEHQLKLHLVPDPRGPITILRMFGDLITWKDDPLPVANPLLVYAELLAKGDPRELEAAEMIRGKYLAK